MAKITYTDKETLNAQPSIADKNKVTSADMNEIKSVVNGLIVNSASTSQEDTYSSEYLNTKLAVTTGSSNELRYIKFQNIVFLFGTVVMNAQTKSFTLPYTPTVGTSYPTTGIFSSNDNIAGYGNLVLTTNSTTANLYMQQAVTRALINCVYTTND